MKTIKIKTSCARLYDDLIVEILSRLPVKSLLRLRCVSRDWLRLISSPSLKQVHDLQRTPNKFLIFSCILKRRVTLYVIDPVDGQIHRQFKLSIKANVWCARTCHGLLYFSDSRANLVYVCNPSTAEVVRLPRSPSARVGMGFLRESNTYKFVVWSVKGMEIFTLSDGGKPSSRTSQWISLKNPPKFHDFHNYSYSVGSESVDGVIYWYFKPVGSEFVLEVFDLRTEECRIIQGPTGRKDWRSNIFELRSSLCLYQSLEYSPVSIEIWVLRDRDAWVHQYSIREALPRLLMAVPAPATATDKYFDRQQEKDLEIVSVQDCRPNLCYYNIKNKRISRRIDPPCVYSKGGATTVYSDTLFSLNPPKNKQALNPPKKNKQEAH